jgi:hypothetical protein
VGAPEEEGAVLECRIEEAVEARVGAAHDPPEVACLVCPAEVHNDIDVSAWFVVEHGKLDEEEQEEKM